MGPSQQQAKEKYRRCAPYFDEVAAPTLGAAYQRRAIALLGLKRGDVVLDVGCGTGSNFAAIESAIGPSGRLFGVDLTEEMLAQARQRTIANGWRNVMLVHAAAERAYLPVRVDALLFSFTHDVLQSADALHNLLGYAKPGARVAACGLKWAPWWCVPLNALVYQLAQQYHTTFDGLCRPWGKLAQCLPHLQVTTLAFGTIYLASGRLGS